MAALSKDKIVIISDLHIGDPTNQLEDFYQDEFFYKFLNEYLNTELPTAVTLVIAGDFIDFAQVCPELGNHDLGKQFGCLETESQKKLARVIGGHPLVFKALADFMAKGNRVILLAGNHDVDLHWPGVQAMLRSQVGGSDRLQFSLPSWSTTGVHIEHGNQHSFDNRFHNWNAPFRSAPDGLRLERPWGTFFMDMIYNEIEAAYPFINKVFPHSEYAWIVARSFWDKDNVSPRLIARLVQFFITDGKRMLAGRLLGDQHPGQPADEAEVLRVLGIERSNPRVTAILQEMETVSATSTPPGLLGHTDDVGQRARAQELYDKGYDVVVFGHTHRIVDGNEDQRPHAPRVFNGGTWMPGIVIDDADGTLHWSDLSKLPLRPQRYATLIEGGSPRLWQLPDEL